MLIRSIFYSLALLALPPLRAQPVQSIQDNSFLIEEAYNQNANVVQHITTFSRMWNSRDSVASFTQEWPVPGHERHQVSYTLAGMSAGAYPGSGPGWGDILLNYRYQVAGSSETRVAFAPRLSALLPTGDSRQGRGLGGAGVQMSLPLSVVLSERWVTHWNAGTTVVPRGRDDRGNRAAFTGYDLGQSVVYLAHPRFNLMLETLWTGGQSHTMLLSPGVRWAYNFPSGLQIVPGIAFPLGVGPSAGERGVFLYLSFEHPFGKRPTAPRN